MKKNTFFLLLAGLLLIPSNILAWGMTGHRIVAQLAQENINEKTSDKINQLLDNMPMAYWANWPDYIKSDKSGQWDHTHIWHYVNAPSNLPKNEFINYIRSIKQDNAYREIPKLMNVLKDNVSSLDQKRTSLIFLIHLMGDIHQPMHVGREDDLGGNKVQVLWFNEPTNLHSVWDGKLIEYEKYSYTEYSKLLDVINEDEKSKLSEGTLVDWVFDSYSSANEIYSSVKVGDKLMYEYNYKYKDLVERQLRKAGLRLAIVLDSIFK